MVERLVLSNAPADTVTTGHLPPSEEFQEQQRIAKETGLRNRNYWSAFLDYFSGDPTRLSADIREQYYDFNRRAPEPHLIGLVAKVADQEKAKAAMKAVKAGACRESACRVSQWNGCIDDGDAGCGSLSAPRIARAVCKNLRGLYGSGHALS
jgi:hypothetical protein